MRCRAPAAQQPRRTADQRAGADRDHARGLRLPPDPAEHFLVLHERFLAESAGNMQHIELRRIGKRCVRREPEALDVAHGRSGLAVQAVARIRYPRQHLERAGQVDLVDAFEQQRADGEMGAWRDHSDLLCLRMDYRMLAAQAVAEMPKTPRSPPSSVRTRHGQAPRPVEVLAFPDVQLLDVTGPLQVFATANEQIVQAGGAPPYALKVVAKEAAQVTASAGLQLTTATLPRAGAALDTLIVAGGPGVDLAATVLVLCSWVRERAARARRVASVCTGAFLLGASGVLDGRRAVPHWSYCDELARRYPSVRVEPDPIFVHDREVWTSAGVTSGIDLALALVEEDLGRATALSVARYLVVFLKRPGGRARGGGAGARRAAGGGGGARHD